MLQDESNLAVGEDVRAALNGHVIAGVLVPHPVNWQVVHKDGAAGGDVGLISGILVPEAVNAAVIDEDVWTASDVGVGAAVTVTFT